MENKSAERTADLTEVKMVEQMEQTLAAATVDNLATEMASWLVDQLRVLEPIYTKNWKIVQF